jgi:hypothetical protein
VLYTVWCLSKLYAHKNVVKTCKYFSEKKTAQIGTNVRTAGYKSVRIRKVPWPATSVKIFQGFPWSQSNYWVDAQIPRCNACFTCSPQMVTLKISPQCRIKFRWNAAPLKPRGLDTRHTDWLVVGRNVTLTIGLDHPVHGGYECGDLAIQVRGVSDETVIYGYGSCATLTSARSHSKLQTRLLVSDGTQRAEERK